jgi:hypothetical protein
MNPGRKCFRGPPDGFGLKDTSVLAHNSFPSAGPASDMDRSGDIDTRGDLEVDTLLKIVLVLVVVWIGIEILESVIDLVFGPFKSIFGLIIVVLILLWLLDRI